MKPDLFEPYLVFAFNRQAFLLRRQEEDLSLPERSFVRCGLPFVRLVAGYLKPTTVFLQRFGRHSSKNSLPLHWPDIRALCKEGEICLPGEALLRWRLESPGYVIISAIGHILGAGLFLDENRLLCRFPKAVKQALKNITDL